MKVLFFGKEFEATLNTDAFSDNVVVMVGKVGSETEKQELLWQPKRKYVHQRNTDFTGLFRDILRGALEKATSVTKEPSPDTKFVILQEIEEGNRFFTDYCPEQDHTKLVGGKVAYRILGYVETMEAAQIYLYGRSYTGGA